MSTAWYGGEWIVGDSLGLELEKEGKRLEKREEVAGFGMEITASRRAKLKNQLRAGEEKLLWTVGRDSCCDAGFHQRFELVFVN